MYYKISHTTNYQYSQLVWLEPHLIRLRSRSDPFQSLRQFTLKVQPTPVGISEITDLEGNNPIKIWFEEPTTYLSIQVISEVETFCHNPFNYLLEPWATKLPITDYSTPQYAFLEPYLSGQVDPVAVNLAQNIWQKVGGQTLAFLGELNQQIYDHCGYTVREMGEPLPAGITWREKLGSCRDFAVLFMEVCRAMGLAARFVSGYQEGDPDQEVRHLHAWVEVYLPGAGWRGYDPTQGLAVSDRHIALFASLIPRHTAPVSGNFRGNAVQSQINYQLFIEKYDYWQNQTVRCDR